MRYTRLILGLLWCTCAVGLVQAQTLDPAPATQPTTQANLPKLAKLLDGIRAAQSTVSDNQLRYLCRETVDTFHTDAATGGELVDTLLYETFYIHQQPVSRLLERNHQPLTATEQAAEETRVQRAATAAETAEPVKPVKWDSTLGGLILLHAQLVHERRVLVDGRPVITLDIREPEHDVTSVPGLIAHGGSYHFSMLEYVADHVRGEVWVDEQDHVIIRMIAEAPDRLAFGSMLLAPKDFPVACYSTTRISDGVYVPRQWCGTVLPMQSLKSKDAVAEWNKRVRRTWYALDGCRLYRSTAHIVNESVTGPAQP